MKWPLRKRVVLLAVLVGCFAGMGLHTFHFAQGFSYMSDSPKTCINCHIMQPEYNSWTKGSHHAAATCNDCHLPASFVAKYVAKSENGYHHSKAFTLQDFHEPIMIKEKNSRILQENCLRCHGEFVHNVVASGKGPGADIKCVHCHASVGHGPNN